MVTDPPVNIFEMRQPDDFHHHLRDGDVLADVVKHAVRSFGRVVAMPNIKPPVRTLIDAQQYKHRIMSSIEAESNSDFDTLMTLYLTDSTT